MLFTVLLSGCTVNFKGENVEFDAERQRVYKIDSIDFFKQTDLEYCNEDTTSSEKKYTQNEPALPIPESRTN